MSDPFLDIPPVGQPRAENPAAQPPETHTMEPDSPADFAPGADPLGPQPMPHARLEEVEAALNAAQGECADLKDKLLRNVADMENLRKRLEREKQDGEKYAAARFAKDILSVADNLGRALMAAPKGEHIDPALKTLVEGVAATEREMVNVFERHGIKRIPAEGARFDPNLHQAMMEVDDPSRPAGTVVQVLMPGFTIADRLLRPAMVAVSKGGPAEAKLDTKA
jgi:molecular chaperone GrpE